MMSCDRWKVTELEWWYFWQKKKPLSGRGRKDLNRSNTSMDCNGLQPMRCLPFRVHHVCVLFHNVNVWFNIKQYFSSQYSNFLWPNYIPLDQLMDIWVVPIMIWTLLYKVHVKKGTVGTLSVVISSSTFWKKISQHFIYIQIDFWLLLSNQQCLKLQISPVSHPL